MGKMKKIEEVRSLFVVVAELLHLTSLVIESSLSLIVRQTKHFMKLKSTR